MIAIKVKGLGRLEQRSYLLLSLAIGGLTAAGNPERRQRATRLWRNFVLSYPRFKSPLITDAQEPA